MNRLFMVWKMKIVDFKGEEIEAESEEEAKKKYLAKIITGKIVPKFIESFACKVVRSNDKAEAETA